MTLAAAGSGGDISGGGTRIMPPAKSGEGIVIEHSSRRQNANNSFKSVMRGRFSREYPDIHS